MKVMWKTFYRLILSTQLPSFVDKTLSESEEKAFGLWPWVSDGHSVTYNHLCCGKLPRKSSHIAQFPVGI